MELQINDLVSAIKKDGIESANKESEAIISDAKKMAESIVANAKAEALRIKEDNEKQIKSFEESAKLSAEQAKRDAILAFKTEVQNEFEKILANEVKKTLDDKLLAKLIASALDGEDVSKFAVELKEINEGLKAELAKEIKTGLEIRVSKNVQGGFKLAAKDGSGYFDCSDEEIKNMLMPFLREVTL